MKMMLRILIKKSINQRKSNRKMILLARRKKEKLELMVKRRKKRVMLMILKTLIKRKAMIQSSPTPRIS